MFFQKKKIQLFNYKNSFVRVEPFCYFLFLKGLSFTRFYGWQSKLGNFFTTQVGLDFVSIISFDFEIFFFFFRKSMWLFSKLSCTLTNRFCYLNTKLQYYSVFENLFQWYSSLAINGYWFQGIILAVFFSFYNWSFKFFNCFKINKDLLTFFWKYNLFLKKYPVGIVSLVGNHGSAISAELQILKGIGVCFTNSISDIGITGSFPIFTNDLEVKTPYFFVIFSFKIWFFSFFKFFFFNVSPFIFFIQKNRIDSIFLDKNYFFNLKKNNILFFFRNFYLLFLKHIDFLKNFYFFKLFFNIAISVKESTNFFKFSYKNLNKQSNHFLNSFFIFRLNIVFSFFSSKFFFKDLLKKNLFIFNKNLKKKSKNNFKYLGFKKFYKTNNTTEILFDKIFFFKKKILGYYFKFNKIRKLDLPKWK